MEVKWTEILGKGSKRAVQRGANDGVDNSISQLSNSQCYDGKECKAGNRNNEHVSTS